VLAVANVQLPDAALTHSIPSNPPYFRSTVTFFSAGKRCDAWHYRPAGAEPSPLIVMAHGFAAEKTFQLPYFADHFAKAGIGVLLTLIAAYLIGPAILAVGERIRPLKSLGEEEAKAFEARQYGRWPTSVVSGITLAIIAFALYSSYVA